jgi:hypothetical protein
MESFRRKNELPTPGGGEHNREVDLKAESRTNDTHESTSDPDCRGRIARSPGADKSYDAVECVRALREAGITPHVAQNDTNRLSAIDPRTTRHEGDGVSL